MKLSIKNFLTSDLFKKILLWILPTVFAFGYTIKIKNDLKAVHRAIAYSTIGAMTNLYNQTKKLENDKTIDQQTYDEISTINDGFMSLILPIGANSIAEIFDELSDNQKEIAILAYHNAMKVLNE